MSHCFDDQDLNTVDCNSSDEEEEEEEEENKKTYKNGKETIIITMSLILLEIQNLRK